MERARARIEAIFWDVHSLTWDAGVDPEEGARRTQGIVARLTRLRARPGERVLDAGCATGEHALALARAGFAVTGVDLSAAMVRRAVRKAAAAGLTVAYRQADFNHSLPFDDGAFDRVLCVAALQCASDPTRVLAEFRRVLVPAGVLALAVKAPDVPPGAPPRAAYAARLFAPVKRWASRHARHWPADHLRTCASAAGFVVIACERAGHDLEITARAP